MRYLGIDYGTVRIGIALSDPCSVIASPLKTVKAEPEKNAVMEIAEICSDKSVEEIVIGLPLHMNGDEGESAEGARKLGDAIESQTQLKVNYIDERLSTVSADKALSEGNVRGKKRKAKVDSVAAAIILQTFLDRKMECGL
jgi:putative Holliday junction resolvase